MNAGVSHIVIWGKIKVIESCEQVPPGAGFRGFWKPLIDFR